MRRKGGGGGGGQEPAWSLREESRRHGVTAASGMLASLSLFPALSGKPQAQACTQHTHRAVSAARKFLACPQQCLSDTHGESWACWALLFVIVVKLPKTLVNNKIYSNTKGLNLL